MRRLPLLALLLPLTAAAGEGPWVAGTGTVGAGTAGVGRGGGASLALGWNLPLLHHKLYLGPTLTGLVAGHSAGGLHQEEQLDATIHFSRQLAVQGAELGALASYGTEKIRGELALGAGIATTTATLSGDLDGTPLPGRQDRARGLAWSVSGGGATPVGPLDLLFALDLRRVPVGDGGTTLIGPRLGLRWGPF